MIPIRRIQGTGWLLAAVLFYLGINPLYGTLLQGIFTCNTYRSCGDATAQEASKTEYYPLEGSETDARAPLEGPLVKVLGEEISLEGQPLEGPVDPETYRLGPGDLIAVYVLGEVGEEIVGRIAADGIMRLVSLGIFDTKDRFFKEVRAEILEVARKRYRTDEIEVSLVGLRSFKASVGGMVLTPGTYEMTATDRVATLLAKAGGFLNPSTLLNPETSDQNEPVLEKATEEPEVTELPPYSTRNLKLIHRNGDSEIVDLLAFLRAGDTDGNPFVTDGDFLLVPPLNSRSGILGIYGAVNLQGQVEYLSGDNLEQAFLLAGGLTPEARRDSVEITRFIGGNDQWETFYVHLDSQGVLQTPLHPDDRVFVRPKPDYHLRYQVELRGELNKPGFFPIKESVTTLADVVEQAGGFTPRASLGEAVLTRTAGVYEDDPEFERLLLMAVKDMTPLEYQYFMLKTREIKGWVAVDLNALFVEGDSTQNVLLRDGDVLRVPPVTRAVKVTGQVTRPGIITFEPDQSYKYYIERAGGFAWNARKGKVRIIKSKSGKWIKPGRSAIEEGDVIFVPEKAYVDFWKVSKDIILVLAQVATIYLIISQATE
jgi:protein involved in polysaccharide export with SLBB domain